MMVLHIFMDGSLALVGRGDVRSLRGLRDSYLKFRLCGTCEVVWTFTKERPTR